MAPLVVAATMNGSVLEVPGVALAAGDAAAPVVPAGPVPDAVAGAVVDELLPVRALHAVIAGTRATATTAAAASRAGLDCE
jgi:hypothetical protein